MKPRAASFSSIFPLLLLAFLCGLTFWLDRATRNDPAKNDGKLRHDPDFIIDSFQLRRFGPTGELQYQLLAQQMRHFPDTDTSVVDLPTIRYTGNGSATLATAQAAFLSPDGKEALLSGDVRVTRGDTNSPQILETSQLKLWPDDERASTDEAVRITRGKSVTTGVGLDADNIELNYRIRKDVRATIYKGEAQ